MRVVEMGRCDVGVFRGESRLRVGMALREMQG